MASQVKLMCVSVNYASRSKAIDIVKPKVLKKSPEADFTQYIAPKPTRGDVSQYFLERNMVIPEHRSCAIDRYFRALETQQEQSTSVEPAPSPEPSPHPEMKSESAPPRPGSPKDMFPYFSASDFE